MADDPNDIDRLISTTIDVEDGRGAAALPFMRESAKTSRVAQQQPLAPAPERPGPPAHMHPPVHHHPAVQQQPAYGSPSRSNPPMGHAQHVPIPPPPYPPSQHPHMPAQAPAPVRAPAPATPLSQPPAFAYPMPSGLQGAPSQAAPSAAAQIYARAQGGYSAPELAAPPPRVADAVTNKAKVESAAAASNAATMKEPSAPASSAKNEVAEPLPPQERVDLLWFDRNSVTAMKAAKLVKPSKSKLDDDWIDTSKASGDERERSDISRIVARGTPSSFDQIVTLYEQALDGHKERAITLVTGTFELGFEPLEALRATLAVVTPFLPADKRLKDAYDAAHEALKTPGGLPPGIASSHRERIDEALRQVARSSMQAIEGVIDRSLIESRAFARRRVFGATHVRAGFSATGSREGIPAYLTESAADELPLMKTFAARAVVEIRPAQDAGESHPLAFRVLAVARLVDLSRARARAG